MPVRHLSQETRDCPSQETVWEFLSDQLCEAEEKHIAGHLAQCCACREIAEQRMGSDPRPAADDDLLELIPEGLKEVLYRMASASTADSLSDTRADDSQACSLREADVPTRVGRFIIVRRLGAGGFGVVLLAHDPVLNRHVALKLPRTLSLADRDQKARFLREAQAAAGLHHPHIVPVFEAGEADGAHYLTVEYCPGPNLAQWLSQQHGPLVPRLAAHIMLLLTRAVEHAHQQGVLHRDIKPGNVLLDPRSAACSLAGSTPAKPPAAEDAEFPFVPKLTDFGLAKLLESDIDETQSGALMGTPRYMAPEQAAARRDQIGPCSDVYALGVMLYELLTKLAPIVGGDNADTLRRVLTEEPLPPRRCVPTIPRDLEAICLKCLEKSPPRRYRTAGELAADLERFLAGESTVARPFGPTERVVRTIRRYPMGAALLATLACAAALAITGLSLHTTQLRELNRRLSESITSLGETNIKLNQAVRSATDAQELAELHEGHSSDQLYATDIATADEALRSGDARQAATLLARHVPLPDMPDRRGFEWHYLQRRLNREHRSVSAHDGDVYMVRYSPDGRHIATCGKDGNVRIWDAATLANLQQWDAGQGEINAAVFSSDGRLLATVGDDGDARIWEWQTTRMAVKVTDPHGAGKAYQAAFYAGDQFLATCGEEGYTKFWSARNGEYVDNMRLAATGSVECIAQSRDRRYLAWGTSKPGCVVRVNDVAGVSQESPLGWRARATLPGHKHTVSGVALSSNNQLIASCDLDGRAILWDANKSAIRREFKSPHPLHSIDFSPDSRWLATGDRDGMVHVWPTENYWFLGEFSHLQWCSILPDARHALAILPDRLVIQDLVEGVLREVPRVDNTGDRIGNSDRYLGRTMGRPFALSHSGRWLLCLNDLYEFGNTNPLDLQPVRKLEISATELRCAAFSPDDSTLAAGLADGSVQLFDATSGKSLARWPTSRNEPVHCLAFTPDGTQIISGIEEISFSDAKTHQMIAASEHQGGHVLSLAISPDGQHLATCCSMSAPLTLWDISTRRPVRQLPGHDTPATSLAWSPQGDYLASANTSAESDVRVWHLPSGQAIHAFPAHADRVSFSATGDVLCAGGRDALWSWNLRDAEALTPDSAATWKAHQGRVWSIAYAADGQTLATGGSDGQLKLWDRRRSMLREVSTKPIDAFFDVSATGMLGVYFNYSLGLLEAESGNIEPLEKSEQQHWRRCSASHDGEWIVGRNSGDEVVLWRASDRRQVARWRFEDANWEWDLKLSPDGQLLAMVSGTDGPSSITLCSPETGASQGYLPSRRPEAIAFSPDSSLLASNDLGDIVLWDTRTKARNGTLRGHTGDRIYALAFSHDGRWLASAGNDRRVKIWDLSAQRELHSLAMQIDPVKVVVFTPDGRSLITGGAGSQPKIWHVQTGHELLELDVKLDTDCLVFLDSNRLALSRHDRSLNILDVRFKTESQNPKVGYQQTN